MLPLYPHRERRLRSSDRQGTMRRSARAASICVEMYGSERVTGLVPKSTSDRFPMVSI